MKHTRMISTAFALLSVGGSAMAHAQGTQGSGQARNRGRDQQVQVPPAEQQRRVQEEQQRAAQYRQHLDQQVPMHQQQTAQLQAQQRMAQYRVQQDYAKQLRQQQDQQRVQAKRDYSRDPYVNTPQSYSYGASRQTNQYGADVLRQAVNYGYQQGVRSGDADRQDRQPSNYQNSIAYRDANYGYNGQYVDRTDYNNYFRQGFRRGYDDGYNRRSQFGTTSNGTSSILGTLLNSILGLQPIR